MKKILLLSFSLFLIGYTANAQYLVENFDGYTAGGNLVGQGNWELNNQYALPTDGGPVKVNATGLNGSKSAHIKGTGTVAGDGPIIPFSSGSLTKNATTGTLYVSFLVKFNALPTGEIYFLYLADFTGTKTSNGRGRVYVKPDPAATGKFAFGITGSGAAAPLAADYTSYSYEPGKTYLVIQKYQKSSNTTDNVSLWVYSSNVTGAEPIPLVVGSPEAAPSKKDIGGIGLRTQQATADILVDDIMVDVAWAGVSGTNVPLPVKLTSFTAIPQNNGVKLNWTTASEQSNSHFDVLRSDDGKAFNVLTTVTGKGTTQQTSNYTYTDANPLSGTNYYQLRQVDLDGKSELSKIIAIKAISEETSLSVYISNTYTKVSSYSLISQKATIRISSIAGNQISEQTIDLAKGHNSIQIPLQLQSGLYVATLSAGSETISTKFISQ